MNLWLIPTFPLLGFVINGLFGRRFPKQLVNIIAVGSVMLSFLWVLKTLMGLGAMETGAGDANRLALRLRDANGFVERERATRTGRTNRW